MSPAGTRAPVAGRGGGSIAQCAEWIFAAASAHRLRQRIPSPQRQLIVDRCDRSPRWPHRDASLSFIIALPPSPCTRGGWWRRRGTRTPFRRPRRRWRRRWRRTTSLRQAGLRIAQSGSTISTTSQTGFNSLGLGFIASLDNDASSRCRTTFIVSEARQSALYGGSAVRCEHFGGRQRGADFASCPGPSPSRR